MEKLFDRITELEELLDKQDEEIFHLKVFSMAIFNILKEIYGEDDLEAEFDRRFTLIYQECREAMETSSPADEENAWRDAVTRLIKDTEKGRLDG
jgi:hypothetical protein